MKNLRSVRRAKKKQDKTVQTAHTLKEALQKIDELENYVEAIKKLKNSKSSLVISPRQLTNTSEATAFAVATDWHIGSVVKPESVSGLNTFNVEIAKMRVKNFFERIVRLTNKERQDIRIDELVLFLGGDLIDGSLHLDGTMIADIGEPIRQSILCQSLIEAGLNFLLEHGKYKRITVVCCDGNHSRTTQKIHFSSRQGNSLEYFMYYNIAARYPNVNWVMANGIHAYLDVYDYTFRFHHGDTISFGGVNGPYTYLNRRIYQWNQAHKADYTVMGHLHMWCIGTRRWLINGSLVGYSPYAVGLGGEFQPPIQAFFLMDKKRGVTVHIPILVE